MDHGQSQRRDDGRRQRNLWLSQYAMQYLRVVFGLSRNPASWKRMEPPSPTSPSRHEKQADD